ncbi:PREDICTED: putative tRNA pseudouridine synthase Pus10 isoform X2 [Priapulus caudatus]|uniref:tRNA pseudouridine(55) synthase n=1 Tax=Priapulus caudatus TaxID=37621 RepID=A0ABM1E2J8_PRICU|nr:PREDICTED: putative tRNA pseudouridine synthase Pus10 isoform X2 [Priapulus caudatus]
MAAPLTQNMALLLNNKMQLFSGKVDKTIPWHSVLETLCQVGCCSRCVLRLLGANIDIICKPTEVVDAIVDNLKSEQLLLNVIEGCTSQIEDPCNSELSHTEQYAASEEPLAHPEICVTCIGLLQDYHNKRCIDQIRQKVEKEQFEYDSFRCSIYLPLSVVLREHAVFVELAKLHPNIRGEYMSQQGSKIVSVKEVWKRLSGPAIECQLRAPFKAFSPFEIEIMHVLTQDKQVLSQVISEVKDAPKKHRSRTALKREHVKQQRETLRLEKDGVEVPDQLSIDGKGVAPPIKMGPQELRKLLINLPDARFSELFQATTTKPTSGCDIGTIKCNYTSLYLAGRYNKYSRMLCQTPWIIDGEKKMNTSVEEIITQPLNCMIRGDETRFASSGREDVDVRTLGNGRPFVIEFINPRRHKLGLEAVAKLQQEINSSTKDVKVNDLQVVEKEKTRLLKDGEENKTKRYFALCWSSSYLTADMLQQLDAKMATITHKKEIGSGNEVDAHRQAPF